MEPARALATEMLKLEHTLSDLINQACDLAPAESVEFGICSFLIYSGGSIDH